MFIADITKWFDVLNEHPVRHGCSLLRLTNGYYTLAYFYDSWHNEAPLFSNWSSWYVELTVTLRTPHTRHMTNADVTATCTHQQMSLMVPARRQWFFEHGSSTTALLDVPRTSTSFGVITFGVAGPCIWNSLLDTIHNPSLSYTTFSRLLSTHLFVWPRHDDLWTGAY